MFVGNFNALNSEIRSSDSYYGIKFVITADRLAGKKRRNLNSEIQVNLGRITEKVFL